MCWVMRYQAKLRKMMGAFLPSWQDVGKLGVDQANMRMKCLVGRKVDSLEILLNVKLRCRADKTMR